MPLILLAQGMDRCQINVYTGLSFGNNNDPKFS